MLKRNYFHVNADHMFLPDQKLSWSRFIELFFSCFTYVRIPLTIYFGFLLVVLSICIQMLSRFPLCNPPSHPPLCLYGGAPPPAHPFLPYRSTIPSHWGIKSPQHQGSLLPLMPDKAVLCYIYSRIHGPTLCTFWLVSQPLGALRDPVS